MTTNHDTRHAANIGRIVLHLANHLPGEWGDCSINHPLVTIIDQRRPADELLAAIYALTADEAAGIVAQIDETDLSSD